MLDGEKVGHFLLMISGVVVSGHSNLKYKVVSEVEYFEYLLYYII